MSRVRKLCEEINAVVRNYGRAYLACNSEGRLIVTPLANLSGATIMKISFEVSEDILMRWENETASRARDLLPNYLFLIKDRLGGDFIAD